MYFTPSYYCESSKFYTKLEDSKSRYVPTYFMSLDRWYILEGEKMLRWNLMQLEFYFRDFVFWISENPYKLKPELLRIQNYRSTQAELET